jgi:hypothetical protein
LRVVNKTLVALLVVALMPAQAAWGQQFVPEGVDESKGDAAVLVRDIFTTGMSVVRNIGVKDAFGNHPFCASYSSESCKDSRNSSFVVNQMLPLCQVDATSSCIEGLDIYAAGTSRQPAQLVRTVDGVQFPKSQTTGLPAGYTPSIWEAPSVANKSGSTKYVLGVKVTWVYRNSKVFLESFSAVVNAVEEVRDSKFGPSGVGTATRDGKTFTYIGAMNDGYTTEECAATEEGYCAKVVDFADNTRVGLSLRMSKQLTGWLQGRVSKPSISVTSLDAQLNRVVIDASPVTVPQLYAEVKLSEQPAWLREMINRGGFGGGGRAWSDRQWKIFSSEGGYVVKLTRALARESDDTSAHVATSWNISSLGRSNSGNQCFDNSNRLVGLVTTNALAYSGGAPVFKNGFLSYQVAGAHYLPDGVTPVQGSYDLALRSETARCLYGFSKAPISGTISVVGSKGEKKIATTILREKAGWLTLAAYGFTFSSPTIKVKLTQKR